MCPKEHLELRILVGEMTGEVSTRFVTLTATLYPDSCTCVLKGCRFNNSHVHEKNQGCLFYMDHYQYSIMDLHSHQ